MYEYKAPDGEVYGPYEEEQLLAVFVFIGVGMSRG